MTQKKAKWSRGEGERVVLDYLATHVAPVSVEEVAADLGRRHTWAYQTLARLEKQGSVQQHSRTRHLGNLYSLPAKHGRKAQTVLSPTVESLVKACGAALGVCFDVTAETLPGDIRAHVEGLAQARAEVGRQWETELEKRHAAEQALADMRAAWEADRANLIAAHTAEASVYAAVEGELAEVKAKLDALDACYRGLFGERVRP